MQPPYTKDEQLGMIEECVEYILANLPDYPCRIDEMTEREARIEAIGSECMGALLFIRDVLDNKRTCYPEAN